MDSRCRRRATPTCSKRSNRAFSAKGHALRAIVVAGGPLDLSRRDSKEVLGRGSGADHHCDARHRGVFAAACARVAGGRAGRVPAEPALRRWRRMATAVRLRLRFRVSTTSRNTAPAADISPRRADHRRRRDLKRCRRLRVTGTLAELARRRVILDLPKALLLSRRCCIMCRPAYNECHI